MFHSLRSFHLNWCLVGRATSHIRETLSAIRLAIFLKTVYITKKGDEMASHTFSAVLHLEKDLYVAECPEVGTVSQGSTIEEAIANLKEATELYLEEFPTKETSHPILTTFEVVIHA